MLYYIAALHILPILHHRIQATNLISLDTLERQTQEIFFHWQTQGDAR